MKKRNAKLRLHRPEGTAAIRHMCMDKEKVSKYFFAMKEVLERRGLLDKPTCIWNMDETGLQLQHPHDLLSPEKALDISKAELVAISS